jgi:hypothetical protein
VRTDADGRYRVDHVVPGRWQVVVAPEELDERTITWSSSMTLDPAHDDESWNARVTAGATTHVDLDLRAQRSGTLRGRLVLDGGAPSAGWTVALRELDALRPDGGAVLADELDADGAFAFEFPRGGRFELAFAAPGEPGRTLALRTIVALAPGENVWERRIALVALSGEGVAAADAPGVAFEYASDGEIEARSRFEPDAQGRFALPRIVARVGELRRYRPATGELGPRWEVLARFDAVAGAPASVRVP